MTHRISILGASGVGATTASRAVARALDLPCFDSDDFYHAPSDPPFNAPRPPQERHDLIVRTLEPHPSWVLGGGVAGWEPRPELGLTLVVFLWVPRAVRIARLRARERSRFGDRIDPGGDMHAQHEDFIVWAGGYDGGDIEGKTLALHEAYLREQRCPVLELRGERPVEAIVAAIVGAARDRD